VGRWLRVLIGLVLFVGAIPIAAFDVFLILYQGDSPGADPSMRIRDARIDAQLVGGLSVALVAAMFAAAWLLLRTRAK
jgi:hypothetical protein